MLEFGPIQHPFFYPNQVCIMLMKVPMYSRPPNDTSHPTAGTTHLPHHLTTRPMAPRWTSPRIPSQVDVARTLPPRPSAPGPPDQPPCPAAQGVAAWVRKSFQTVPGQAPPLAQCDGQMPPTFVAPTPTSTTPGPSRLTLLPSLPSIPLAAPVVHPPVKADAPSVTALRRHVSANTPIGQPYL
jgi:hypothetical protein